MKTGFEKNLEKCQIVKEYSRRINKIETVKKISCFGAKKDQELKKKGHVGPTRIK